MKVSEKKATDLKRLQERIRSGFKYFNGKEINESYIPETIEGCKGYIKLMDTRYGWIW
jgi:hypothetical protein